MRFTADRYKPLDEKFWTRIRKDGEHWLWLSSVSRDAKGVPHPKIKDKRRSLSARRVSWELRNGPIPPRHEIYVTCCNPLCLLHLACRAVGSRPVHPNSIASVQRQCRNRALPVAKRVPIFFQPENLSNKEVSRLTGVGQTNVQRLRSDRAAIPTRRTRALRAVINREGVSVILRFLAGTYPPCPRCGRPMERFDSVRSICQCAACGKYKTVSKRSVTTKPIRIKREKLAVFVEAVATGKPSRRAAKLAGIASVTVPKIRALIFAEFGPPRGYDAASG